MVCLWSLFGENIWKDPTTYHPEQKQTQLVASILEATYTHTHTHTHTLTHTHTHIHTHTHTHTYTKEDRALPLHEETNLPLQGSEEHTLLSVAQ